MDPRTDRRSFIKGSLLTPAAAAMAMQAGRSAAAVSGGAADGEPALPQGEIKGLKISRMLLGGNLLTHYTHSRDLKYVYNLTAHYNTDEKILETLALAEEHGINTLSIHTVPRALQVMKRHRQHEGGKMQWIICPTAPVVDGLEEYRAQVRALVDDGTEAIYLWGVHSDNLVKQDRVDLIAAAVEVAQEEGVPSGVGAHDLRVVKACEEQGVPADFYIKTFHHHRYPSAPKKDEIRGPYNEFPGYWCSEPETTAEVMAKVEKPWIAFKVMAAGVIPPADAFEYALSNGADHLLVGMFDFEIAEDAKVLKDSLAKAEGKRSRPWRS